MQGAQGHQSQSIIPQCVPSAVIPLPSAGLAANEQLLRLMALRYGDAARRIGFSDFVCCMLRLETMTCESQHWGLGLGRGRGSRGACKARLRAVEESKGHAARDDTCLSA